MKYTFLFTYFLHFSEKDYIWVWDDVKPKPEEIPLVEQGTAKIVSLDVLKDIFDQSVTSLEVMKNNEWKR